MAELKGVNGWVTIPVLMLTALAGQPAFSATQAERVSGKSSPAASASSILAHSKRPITDDGLQILGLGRQVYGDLQLARQAALNRQIYPLQFALRQVQKELAQLNRPPALATLRAQMVVIGNNLADTTKSVDAGLWVPIDTELEAVSLYLPPQVRGQARAAARVGRIAVAKGDRATAGDQVNLLVSFLRYETGAFPLQRVRADIQSAWSAASLSQPYWKGALEAVQSALGEIHWVTGGNARPLLSAYNNAVNAYILWPQREQTAIDYLAKAQQALSTLPDGAALAAQAHHLTEKNNLDDSDLKRLITRIGVRIDQERATGRERLLNQLTEAKKNR